VAPKVTASAVRLVRKRKVLALNGQFRPKRPENGLYQGHTARASAGNSTSEGEMFGTELDVIVLRTNARCE
jgi:hypothetical protein